MMLIKKKINLPETVSLSEVANKVYLKSHFGKRVLNRDTHFNLSYLKEEKVIECFNSFSSNIKKENRQKNKEFQNFISELQTSIKGLSSGFIVELKLNGIGFRFISLIENKLAIKLGFCHHVIFSIPKNVEAFIESPTKITLFSLSYSNLKQTASSLVNLRSQDSYKGKGLVYANKNLKLKEVKKS